MSDERAMLRTIIDAAHVYFAGNPMDDGQKRRREHLAWALACGEKVLQREPLTTNASCQGLAGET